MPWTDMLIKSRDYGDSNNEEGNARIITYASAIREALDQALARDSRVFVMGQGVDDPGGMFGVTLDLHRKYGSGRVFDTPLSENALTGIALGTALAGMRPFYCHNRPDFLMPAMDQLVNHASKWSYMFGGKANVPMVIWAATGRGWGSGAQHSQSLQGLFIHVPGLKVITPSTPYDAKGLTIAAIADENPVLILEHRWLFRQKGNVPEEVYAVPIGKAALRRKGKHVTIAAVSYMVVEALDAAQQLDGMGIEAEVIDMRSLKPLDEDLLISSISRTGRLVVADTGWRTGGVSSEIAAAAVRKGFKFLRAPVRIVACPDVPTPASWVLEEAFYKNSSDIVSAVEEVMSIQ